MTDKEKIEYLSEALEFYADPNSYFGIIIFGDHPCGDFADDFSEDHGFNQYDRPMPGKYAREVLKKLGVI